jgi:hypothetical protein
MVSFVPGDRLTEENVSALHHNFARTWGLTEKQLDEVFSETLKDGVEFGRLFGVPKPKKIEESAYDTPLSTDAFSYERLLNMIVRAGKRTASTGGKIAARKLLTHLNCALAVYISENLLADEHKRVTEAYIDQALNKMFPGGMPYLPHRVEKYANQQVRQNRKKRAAETANIVEAANSLLETAQIAANDSAAVATSEEFAASA